MQLRRIFLAALFLLFSLPAYAALTIDGTCATNSSTATTTVTLSQTTSLTNDIIIVGVHQERTNAQGSFATVQSISDTAGLTWHLRKQVQMRGSVSEFSDAEVWWAFSPGTLSADTITITFTATIDDSTAGSCGVNGANTSNPFDSNASLPASATATASSAPTVSGVTTSNSADMLLGFIFNSSGGAQAGAGTFGGTTGTLDFSKANLGGTNDSYSSGQHLVVAATQSSISFVGLSASTNWIAIGDAICASGGTSCTGAAVAATHNLLLMGVGN